MLVRIPKDKDETVTLKPGFDFRGPNERSPWDRPTPEEIEAQRKLQSALFGNMAARQNTLGGLYTLGMQSAAGSPFNQLGNAISNAFYFR